MRTFSKVVLVSVLLAGLLLLVGAADTPDLAEQAIALVAAQYELPAGQVELASLSTITLPFTDVTYYQAKVLDPAGGAVYGVALNDAGVTVDPVLLRAAEEAAREAQVGALDPVLYQRLQEMHQEDRLLVAIWLRADGVTPRHRPVPDAATAQADLESAAAANVMHMQNQIAAVQAPLLADLEAAGYKSTYVSPLAPLIYVELPRSEIEAVATRGDVEMVYPPYENFDLMNSAKSTQKANVVDSWGYDGSGVDVAIIEDSRIEFNNPYLNSGAVRVPADPNVDDHATATAGMVASQHSTYQGISQGVDLLSANATNYSDPNLSAAIDWAVNQGAVVLNNSWGGNVGNTDLNVHDRHLDYIVRNYWRTVTVAAGNQGGATNRITSPARGYNVLSVGNYADNNTLTWADDAMDGSSSYVDPSTGCEKPEVSAVGSDIFSTISSSPWIGDVGGGTSYSAPMVAGEAALLMQRNTSLQSWPEATKAIIMATALHNIEGSSRLSEIDGAGGVDMRAAFHLVDEGWWHARTVDTNSFPISYWFTAYEGQRVRAAIAWDSNPAADYSTDPLEADIDLYVYDSGGTYIAGSASSFNSFEVVEFVAPATGNYELRVNKYSFTGSSTYLGVAWWPGARQLSAHVPQYLGAPPVSRDDFGFEPSLYWNGVAVRPESGVDVDLQLYHGSPFDDPAQFSYFTYSAYGGNAVDFILIDRNHAVGDMYCAETYLYTGSGSYDVEWAPHTHDTVGSYGPFSMSAHQVIRVWDSYLENGLRKYFALKPVSGSANLGMALYDSDYGTPSTYFRRRSDYVVMADGSGAGGPEYMNYLSSETDWMGLVVWSDGAASTTTFYLYTDTTAPTGSVAINGGATYANNTAVTLDLSAADAQTGVEAMRFGNAGGTWSAWEPYGTSKAWTLPAGDGSKTVYVQFRNNAHMVSQYSDTIYLDTTAPVSSATSPPTVDGLVIPVSWSGADSGSGVTVYDVQYRVGTGGAWTNWLTGTPLTGAPFGPDTPLAVHRGETYYFRVRAHDLAGNVEAYPGGNGDTGTYVELLYLHLPAVRR